MLKLISVVLCIFLAGCATTDLMQAKLDLDSRFTAKADIDDQWTMLAESGPVAGDCEDYAMTLQQAAGGQLWEVFDDGPQSHMILCQESRCADNNSALLFSLDPYRYLWMRKVNGYEVWKKTQQD